MRKILKAYIIFLLFSSFIIIYPSPISAQSTSGTCGAIWKFDSGVGYCAPDPDDIHCGQNTHIEITGNSQSNCECKCVLGEAPSPSPQGPCVLSGEPCGSSRSDGLKDCCYYQDFCFADAVGSTNFTCHDYNQEDYSCTYDSDCPTGLFCNEYLKCGASWCCVPYNPHASPKTQTATLKPVCCNAVTGKTVSCDVILQERPGIEMPGIQTALGCFPTSPQAIIQWILKYAIIFAGGIGFLLMLFASFQMMTSSGDPEKLKSARGLFSSAIMGILIIVFSLFILRFIGATILKIPGWQ